ncbi:MAG: RNA polymerase sigma factor [Bacteroidales bacterium]|jgi:RNA polymerase sigma-70 factor (ECF subfamily)|nr:RNA polymerase sigma factor [Bacteroidales bacterium]
MKEYSDGQLLEIFQDEDRRYTVFNEIVKRYKVRLYWHIRKILITHEDTDDVLQNTFVKAWRGLVDFRQEAQLYTWLYRIATNESISFLKQKRNRSMLSLEEAGSVLSQSLDNGYYFSGDELQLQLQKAILTLPEKQRIVFNMKYFDEMQYDEISEILGTSVGALKASYHHAIKKIKLYFEEIIVNVN